jgi:hypothetical protein
MGICASRAGCYRAPETLIHQRVELNAGREEVWISHRGVEVARYPRSYEPGSLQPPARMRPEPAPVPKPLQITIPHTAPPELAEYAALCA